MAVGAGPPSSLRLIHLLEMRVFLLNDLQLLGEVGHAIMSFLLLRAKDSHERALLAFEQDCGTLILMRKQLFITHDFSAALVFVAASELNFTKEISGHSVYPVELTFLSAKGAGVWILLKPRILTIPTQRLLASFAFDGVFEDVVADAADQFRQKSIHLLSVIDFVFFINIFFIAFVFVNDAFHTL